jgi:DegV family protein with EDD domain
MKYKIVVDSSSDLKNDYICDSEVGFEVVPLTINVDEQCFVDNKELNVDEMLSAMHACKTKSTSACPSCGYFSNSYNEAEYVICITMTSKLSGTYNAAYLGSQDCKGKVHVVDSKATGGVMQLLVDKAYELIKENLEFDEVCNKLEEYKEELNLLFVLDTFENLVKAGRMSKIAAFIANALYIKPLCVAQEGVIEVYEKPRTRKGALSRLVESIGKKCSNTEKKKCVIGHCKNLQEAEWLKKEIETHYQFKEVVINDMKGLCSYYALEKGIIVSF